MSEELIVRHCSPTLAGLKTGSLFTCPYSCKEEIVDAIRKMNQQLVAKGLRILPLRFSAQRALIYVYRPQRLKRDISCPHTQRLLQTRGYPCSHSERCVNYLIQKLRHDSKFPHEIGLFLGYPPEDVQGFIENNASSSKCVGCWKVYSNEKQAQRLFDRYKKCTHIYFKQWTKGKSIPELAVSSDQ